VVLPRPQIFRLRRPSLVRGLLLTFTAMAMSLRLAGWPDLDHPHGTNWQILAVLTSLWGFAETARCLRRKWSLYHAGVLILVYACLMAVAMTVFFWLYL
jgi:hypothetical protein